MKLLSKSFHTFRDFFPRLLAFDIFFMIITFAIWVPLSAWVVGKLIASSGDVVIGNTDIAGFFLSPVGILTIVLGGAFFFASYFMEQTGVVALGSSRWQEQDVSLVDALWLVVKKFPSLVGLSLLWIIIFLVAALPFLALGALTYLNLLGSHNINYYLAETPPVFWVAVAIIAVLLVAMVAVLVYLYLRWLFSVPAIVFEGKRSYAALKRSGSLMKGNFMRSGVVLLFWAIAMMVLTGVVVALLSSLTRAMLSAVEGNLQVVVVVSALMAALLVVVTALLSFLRRTVTSLLVLHLYSGQLEREGSSVPAPTIPQRALVGGHRLSRRWLLLGFAVIVLIVGVVMTMNIVDSLDVDTDFDVTAHRGYAAVAPENTIAAIEAAIEAGAEFAEIDVQETADGEIVVLHDDDLMKVSGVPSKIWDVTYDEIKDLDVGSWFAPEFADQRLPTLDETIDASRDKIKLMVELKYNSHDEDLASRVVDVIQDNDFVSQTVIQSLKYDGLMETKRLEPNLEVGYTLATALGDLSGVDADFLSIATSMATPAQVQSDHENGRWVAVWTVNDENEAVSMALRGVDNIITDEVSLLVNVREELAELSDASKMLLVLWDWIGA
jgi:glycerophosphoryl diester phosphodiesterase